MRIPQGTISALAVCFSCLTVAAQPVATPSHAAGVGARPAAEARAARAYDEAMKSGPLAVYAFLVGFPKGADLHVHLSGAVYAETFIRDAAEDKLCVDPAGRKFARDDQGNSIKEPCPAPLIAASQLTGHSLKSSDQDIYDSLVNSFSMRSYVASPGFSGHDQFFATFGKFGSLDKSHTGEWVDEVAARAAAENEQYLELMQTPQFSHAAAIAREIGWPAAQPDFAQLRQQLLDRGLRDEVDAGIEDTRSAEVQRKQIERCSTPEAAPACHVEVRYIYQILRASPPEIVFAQTLLGFETIQKSMDTGADGFVGINFVQPEDGFVSMRDYSLHMKMLDYLHAVYPRVHISLHAGELAPGLAPPEGLLFHIRQAVEEGHAERIGHGVDVMYETDSGELIKEMARKHIMVEVNLSSNEGILGVKGNEHPFPIYLRAHVPVALSTDDEGVSRIDLAREYQRAAIDYRLSYGELKQLARTGMEHDFLPGDSLWAEPDAFASSRAACRGEVQGSDKPSERCKSFLDKNEKAAAQWELERRFRLFEAKY